MTGTSAGLTATRVRKRTKPLFGIMTIVLLRPHALDPNHPHAAPLTSVTPLAALGSPTPLFIPSVFTSPHTLNRPGNPGGKFS
jgi:hypothetical protein